MVTDDHERNATGVAVMKVFPLIVGIALTLAASAAGAGQRASSVLNLHGVVNVSASPVSCPAGAASGAECFAVSGRATIRGLGRVTDRHTIITVGTADGSNTACSHVSFSPDVITVAGKGEIDSSITVAPGCNGVPNGFVVNGGSGDFAGVSGSGTFAPDMVRNGQWVDPDDNNPEGEDILSDWHTDSWTGSLNAPGYTFDLTPPVLSGAASKKVTAPKGVRHVRVRFAVEAKDAVDGAAPVSCKPRSGSQFGIGRTQVKCSATDSSANTATARFTITVRYRR